MDRALSSMIGQTESRQGVVSRALDYCIEAIAPCPWGTLSGSRQHLTVAARGRRQPLYTPVERARRDASPWTMVQGILAPVQFLIFLVSLGLVLNYLATGHGYGLATASILLKTLALYVIMITGAIWEKVVFGRYLFAPAFFWEDATSMVVLLLHTVYLGGLIAGVGTPEQMMMLALAAYASYLVNATQFIVKLRIARLDRGLVSGGAR